MDEPSKQMREPSLVSLFSLRRVLSLEGIRDATIIVVGLVFAGGIAFAVVEGVSVWNGVWFVLNMVTTVGNPGYNPETVEGRLIAIAVMVVGIAFVAMVTAYFAERFIRVGGATDLTLSKLDAIERRLERLERNRQQ